MTTTEFELFEIMRTTRSMRRLKPDPVPGALLNKILESGYFCGQWRQYAVLAVPGYPRSDDQGVGRSVVSEGMARGGGATLPIKQACAGCDARGLRPDVGGG